MLVVKINENVVETRGQEVCFANGAGTVWLGDKLTIEQGYVKTKRWKHVSRT